VGQHIAAEGLDANWDYVMQTKALDATLTSNPVAWAAPMLRIFRMRVLANVVNASSIRAHNAAQAVNYAVIEPVNEQTLVAIYTVPNGKTAYITGYYATLNSAAAVGPTGLTISLWERDNTNGYAPQIKHVQGLDPDATSLMPTHLFKPYKKVLQKTDVWITAAPVGKDANVSAGFDLILVDN